MGEGEEGDGGCVVGRHGWVPRGRAVCVRAGSGLCLRVEAEAGEEGWLALRGGTGCCGALGGHWVGAHGGVSGAVGGAGLACGAQMGVQASEGPGLEAARGGPGVWLGDGGRTQGSSGHVGGRTMPSPVSRVQIAPVPVTRAAIDLELPQE